MHYQGVCMYVLVVTVLAQILICKYKLALLPLVSCHLKCPQRLKMKKNTLWIWTSRQTLSNCLLQISWFFFFKGWKQCLLYVLGYSGICVNVVRWLSPPFLWRRRILGRSWDLIQDSFFTNQHCQPSPQSSQAYIKRLNLILQSVNHMGSPLTTFSPVT